MTEEQLAKARAYRAANSDRIKAQRYKRYRERREEVAAIRTLWKKNNPDKVKQHTRNSRERFAVYRKQHHAENLQYITARSKAWRIRTAEDRNTKAKQYYESIKHDPDFKAKRKAYRDSYRAPERTDKDKERSHLYYLKNKKRIQEYKKLHKSPSNPEKTREKNNRRRVARAGAPGSHTEQEWMDMCLRFEGRCVCCGDITPLTRDHVIPLSSPGSSDYISNIQPLCLSCNSAKRHYHSTDYRIDPFRGRDRR